ncbi:hypothetical protein PCIT_a2819 [Pseudoalteromonas citrea]|uniref:Uncharacterized protein n=1 Tax=Pseudoalteromonas citrea TaxID=43655 RepID=A0AAD4AHT3_9GAMM|nr:hypothetical protein PCIT_a2819 [Pseudoalteromonas citrea]
MCLTLQQAQEIKAYLLASTPNSKSNELVLVSNNISHKPSE